MTISLAPLWKIRRLRVYKQRKETRDYLLGISYADFDVDVFAEGDQDLKNEVRLDQAQEVLLLLWQLDFALALQHYYVAFDLLVEYLLSALDFPLF